MVYSRPDGRLAQRESAAFTRQRTLVRSQHRPLSRPSILQVKREAKIKVPDTHRGLVQEPCSNPSEHPEILRKPPQRKSASLQGFCKLWKLLANYRAAFARRRSGVRIPSAPLMR